MLTDISNVIGVHNIKNDVQYEAIDGSNATKLLGQFSGFNKYAGLSIGFSARSNCNFSQATKNIKEHEILLHGKVIVWIIGEIYKCDWLEFDILKKEQPSGKILATIFDTICKKKWNLLANLDGQFVIVILDQEQDELTIINDRFGGIPIYYSSNNTEFIFSTSLKAIATLPIFDYQPDLEAIRESVSFGGFRLGDRTTVKNVKLLPWGSVLSSKNSKINIKRYWNPQDTRRKDLHLNKVSDLVDEGYSLWQSSIQRRLVGLSKPGQTLSGGLDSRAILAEVYDKVSEWTSISFGIPNCDDVKYAFQASQTAGIRWIFHPLYYGFSQDWIEKRSQYIWESDGMVDFSNLMHWESLPLQTAFMDGHLSGFIGDVVCGGSWDNVQTIDAFLNRLPYYATSIGFNRKEAQDKVARIIAENSAWDIKYIFYEAKVSQQTNLIFQAPFSRIKVRKPFVDYDLFDFFESLPNQTRSFLYPTMLKTKYGFLYKTIPNQKTGMPVMTPSWLINTERGRRLIYRNLQPLLKKMGFSSEPRVRNFLDDHYATSIDKSKAAIVEVLLGQSSLVCETLGKEKLSAFIESWFNSASVPSNALAALFAFEIFHKEVLKYRKS